MALRTRDQLHAGQAASADLILEKERVLLALPTGFGKTAATLDALATLFARGDASRVLIAAPPRVAASVWTREAARWQPYNHLNVVPVVGGPKERLAMLKGRTPGIFCISLPNLKWLLDNASKIGRFDALVIDEASRVKNPTAAVTRAAIAISHSVRYCVLLSATPRPQGAYELWSQLFCLDHGKRLGASYSRFMGKYFWEPAPYRLAARPGANEAIQEAVADIVKTAKPEDFVDLPPKVRNVIEVELPADARKIYDSLEADAVAKIGNRTVNINPSVLFGKLAQVANGILIGTDGVAFEPIHDAKLKALHELLEGINAPALIFYRFIADREQILGSVKGAEHFNAKSPRELDRLLKRWGDGDIPALVAHHASVGHGVDSLQSQNNLVWYGLPLGSVEGLIQAEGRVHRQGQENHVFVHELHALNTIDDAVRQNLFRREGEQGSFIDALAGYLRDRKHALPQDFQKTLSALTSTKGAANDRKIAT